MERLITLFRMERFVHLVVTVLSLLMLLVSAGFLIWRTGADIGSLSGLFGASGLITYSANRLLRMWDQALQVLQLSKGDLQ